jgi:hypothetical protein
MRHTRPQYISAAWQRPITFARFNELHNGKMLAARECNLGEFPHRCTEPPPIPRDCQVTSKLPENNFFIGNFRLSPGNAVSGYALRLHDTRGLSYMTDCRFRAFDKGFDSMLVVAAGSVVRRPRELPGLTGTLPNPGSAPSVSL